MKVGIKTISQLSGFSPATVSNVLNNKRGANKNTVEKILQIAREVGYIDESKIDSIKLIIYKKHGLVVGDTPFFSALMEGVESACRSRGYLMSICNLNQKNEDFDTLMQQLLNDRTTALLLLATELSEKDVEVFEQCMPPLVILDSWFRQRSFNSVMINNTDSVQNAVDYLVQKGHTRIGHLKSCIPIQNFYYRERGYARSLSENGIPIIPTYDVSLTPTMDGSYRDMKAYLQTVETALPSAYFADNDIIALGAMKALQEAGYRIPADISIIGFDDMPFCEISSPPLTTIRVDKHQMGSIAVKMLSDNIGEKLLPNFKLSICTQLVERESVRDLHKTE